MKNYDLIKKVLRNTWIEFERILQETPSNLINESVFRYFFCKEFTKADQNALLQIEWNRYDLLVQTSVEGQYFDNILIEFKYYVFNKSISLDRLSSRRRGGPSQQNFREFIQCVDKLNDYSKFPEVKERYLILVYQDIPDYGNTRYHQYYSGFGERFNIFNSGDFDFHLTILHSEHLRNFDENIQVKKNSSNEINSEDITTGNDDNELNVNNLQNNGELASFVRGLIFEKLTEMNLHEQIRVVEQTRNHPVVYVRPSNYNKPTVQFIPAGGNHLRSERTLLDRRHEIVSSIDQKLESYIQSLINDGII